jgi:hypothetical protein
MWYTDDNGKACFKPRADHPEWQRAARYRDQVIAYRTAVAQALLLLDAVREPRDAAYAVAAEDGPPPEAFDADEAYYFASLWRHYTHDLGYAAEGVHGDGGGCDEETDVGAVFNLRESLKELDLLIAQFTRDFDFAVTCERTAESAEQ